MLFESIFSLPGLISLCTLALLEIVLGIDNIIFISLITQDLEKSKQPMARRLGLILALVFPNMIGLLILFPRVKEELGKYLSAIAPLRKG